MPSPALSFCADAQIRPRAVVELLIAAITCLAVEVAAPPPLVAELIVMSFPAAVTLSGVLLPATTMRTRIELPAVPGVRAKTKKSLSFPVEFTTSDARLPKPKKRRPRQAD